MNGRRRRRLVPGAMLLVLLAGGVAAGEGLTPPTTHVLLVGDSILRQTGPALGDLLGDGSTVHNDGVNSSGLLTPEVFDWRDRLGQELVRTDPDVVVMLFIGNYTDDRDHLWHLPNGGVVRDVEDPAFAREWGHQADLLMAEIAPRGIPVVLVLPPPMPTEELQGVVAALRTEYERIAREWPQVRLVDAADVLGGPNGEWVGELPVIPGGPPRTVRVADGVHLTDAGQRLLAEAIAPAIRPPQAA
jgi:uncharacterized protein